MTDNLGQIDLHLTRRQPGIEVSDREAVDLRTSTGGDLVKITGRANLAQSIINRLLTRKGELSQLGHSSYGSRLYELIGEPNNTRTRGLAELYIRESLKQERRIEEITEITFTAPSRTGEDREELKITINVKPVGEITITI